MYNLKNIQIIFIILIFFPPFNVHTEQCTWVLNTISQKMLLLYQEKTSVLNTISQKVLLLYHEKTSAHTCKTIKADLENKILL